MSNSQHDSDKVTLPTVDEDARLFYENLERNGQLVNVDFDTNTSALPAKVSHVRYPDGKIKRIRMTPISPI